MDGKQNIPLTAKEVAAAFSDPLFADKFPPILSVDQAAQLLQVPKGTIYDWSSRGRLENCSFPAGRYLRILARSLGLKLFNGD